MIFRNSKRKKPKNKKKRLKKSLFNKEPKRAFSMAVTVKKRIKQPLRPREITKYLLMSIKADKRKTNCLKVMMKMSRTIKNLQSRKMQVIQTNLRQLKKNLRKSHQFQLKRALKYFLILTQTRVRRMM